MDNRSTVEGIHQLFVDRWSPRAFDQSAIPAADLGLILTAAGLAPSAFNYQPWRFLYATRDSADWGTYVSLLNPFNAAWASSASALVVIVSDTFMQQGEAMALSHSHSFDAGAAWAQLALQATALGYHAHAMTGLDFDRARLELNVPQHFRIEAAVAIGRRADASILPEALRDREKPSGRKSLGEIALAGVFPS